MTQEPRLPDGTRLLHIGPHKTGTTTLQAAFHQNRDRLLAQGVRYAGNRAHPMTAAMAAATGRVLATESSAALHRWQRLVEEVQQAEAPRVVISSEFFCEADDEHIRSIVSDLGPEQTHVVITLRPLAKILPSQWQQYVQNLMRTSYPAWLDAMFNRADTTALTPTFWRRHRHDELVDRWAGVVGPDNVTVVVVDEHDRRMLMRTFENMLGLEAETLVPRNVAANRSLTYAEVEILRHFNTEYRARDWAAADYTRLVRFGAARRLQQRRPGPDEEGLLTPAWAVERAVELAGRMAERIGSAGVRVVGDLSTLASPLPDSAIGENPITAEAPVEVAARFVSGLLESIAEVPARRPSSLRSVGPVEGRLRGTRTVAREEAELEHVAARLERTRADLARPWRAGELDAGQLLRILRRRLAARLRAGLRRPAAG